MPVFGSGAGQAPAWCELHDFEIIRLREGETCSFDIAAPKEKWLVGAGECAFIVGGRRQRLGAGGQLDAVRGDAAVTVAEPAADTVVIRMCGRWGDDLGGAGLFSVVSEQHPKDIGDPADYPKQTNFDRHYHDCDEYWIVYEGGGIVSTENKLYEVKAGDCVATGRGFHHDFPVVHGAGPMRAVFFETTMEERKRRGHLWNHTHGEARPALERV